MPLGAAKFAYQGYQVVAAAGPRTAIDITAVNDTQVDTAVSKFGGGSMLMDGTGDYAYISGGTVDLSGDFTIEFWIYYNSLQNANILDWRGIHSTHTGGGTGIFALGDTLLIANNAGDFKCWIDGADRSTSGVIFSTGTWYHIAVQRQSGTINAWVNGTRYVDYAGSDDYSSVLAANQPIGANSSTSSQVSYLDGAIDEFRISTVARYTNGASITVPTAAFVNDSDTYLLHHMNGIDGSTTFTDDIGVGEPGSLLFDGTGDVINAGTTVLPTGTTATWTVECWFRQSATQSATKYFFSNQGSAGQDIAMFIRTDNQIGLFINGTVTGFFSGTGYIQNDTWHHLAWTRDGNTVAMYVDGVQRNTTTTGATFTTDTSTLRIGAQTATGSNSLNGHMDLIRISDTVRYTDNFNPVADFTSDGNTLLLMKADDQNAGSTTITDSSGNETLTAVNDAQIDATQYYDVNKRDFVNVEAYADAQVDTAQSKFGGASALFDGTGDGLLAGEVELSSGAWTMECFIRFVNTNTSEILFDPRFGAQPARVPALRNGKIGYFNGSWQAGATVLSANTWYHFAWVYDGTNLKGYVDGTLDLTVSEAATFIDSKVAIGARYDIGAVYYNGHLDEIRISNNARYTSNFTAPSAAFTNDANTVLLLHCDGTDTSTMFRDDNG